jgi:hypothetical protein
MISRHGPEPVSEERILGIISPPVLRREATNVAGDGTATGAERGGELNMFEDGYQLCDWTHNDNPAGPKPGPAGYLVCGEPAIYFVPRETNKHPFFLCNFHYPIFLLALANGEPLTIQGHRGGNERNCNDGCLCGNSNLTLAPTENLEFLRDGKFTVLTPDYLRNLIDEVRKNGVNLAAKGGMAPVPEYLKKYVLQTERIEGEDYIKVEITPERIKG